MRQRQRRTKTALPLHFPHFFPARNFYIAKRAILTEAHNRQALTKTVGDRLIHIRLSKLKLSTLQRHAACHSKVICFVVVPVDRAPFADN